MWDDTDQTVILTSCNVVHSVTLCVGKLMKRLDSAKGFWCAPSLRVAVPSTREGNVSLAGEGTATPRIVCPRPPISDRKRFKPGILSLNFIYGRCVPIIATSEIVSTNKLL